MKTEKEIRSGLAEVKRQRRYLLKEITTVKKTNSLTYKDDNIKKLLTIDIVIHSLEWVLRNKIKTK